MASLMPMEAAAIALPSPAITAVTAPTMICPLDNTAQMTAIDAQPRELGISKSSAILGGIPSALDRIRDQQAGVNLATDLPINIEVEARQASIAVPTCLAMAPIAFPTMAPEPIAPAISDTFLGAARVRVNRTPFTQDWSRVSRAALNPNQVTNLVDVAPENQTETLSRVNAWVNRNITPVDDIVSSRSRDYWATAPETLSARAGDCEDFAILKYQMLAALGFDHEDMYLTLARDLVRNADHAVLIVRVQGRPYMLDNATDALLPADRSYDYRPTMSFNRESGYIHGFVNSPRDFRQTLAFR